MATTYTGGALVPSASYAIDPAWQTNAVWTSIHKPGSAGAATVVVAEQGNGVYRRTVLRLSNFAISLVDAHVGGGSLLYTFPAGGIYSLGGISSLAETTTSALASTLNASSTLSVGVGSVKTTTQDSGTLATTEQDFVNAHALTSSATINVPGAAGAGKVTATTLLRYDGIATATAAYLNIGVPTATDIDGDATCTVSGTVVLCWIFGGTL